MVKLNGEFYGHLTVEKLDSLLDDLEGAAAGGGTAAAEEGSAA